MNPTLKGSLYTVAFIVATEIIYKTYRRLTNKKTNQTKDEQDGNSSLQVLFFPDSEVPCRQHFITGNGCFKDACQYSHSDTALSELYKHMLSCKSSMDICVFVITCKDLADVLIRLFKKGVKIRIITDQEQLQASGSQIWELIKYGIPVRTNSSSYFMHHKFAIVDNRVLINGSFNWTRQAITGNQENLIITSDVTITQSFVREFDKLWNQYDSRMLKYKKMLNSL